MENFKKFTTSDNKNIYVLDDVFDLAESTHFYKYCCGSYYKLTGGAGGEIDNQKDMFFQAMYTEYELDQIGFFRCSSAEKLKPVLNNYYPFRSYALVGNYSGQPHFHIDGSDLTLVYYVNPMWNPDWGGETNFTNGKMTDIEYTSMYKPNRVVIFDSSIPHKPCTATIKASSFRFTFVVNFLKK